MSRGVQSMRGWRWAVATAVCVPLALACALVLAPLTAIERTVRMRKEGLE